MMKELIWAEHQKLRRSKIVLVAIFAVIMVAIIVFTQGQFSFGEKRYIDDAGWFMNAAQSLATFFVLPAVIALLGSYMICREEQEDTIKSLRLIPISEAKMTIAKLLITFAFSVLFYLLLFGITFLVEVILHFRGLSIKMILSFFKIYLLDGIGIFFAIAPVIAVVSRIKKGYWLALIFTVIYSFAGLFTSISDVLSACYPITATFNISGYYSATFGEIIISLMSLFFCGLFSVLILISKKTIKKSGGRGRAVGQQSDGHVRAAAQRLAAPRAVEVHHPCPGNRGNGSSLSGSYRGAAEAGAAPCVPACTGKG